MSSVWTSLIDIISNPPRLKWWHSNKMNRSFLPSLSLSFEEIIHCKLFPVKSISLNWIILLNENYSWGKFLSTGQRITIHFTCTQLRMKPDSFRNSVDEILDDKELVLKGSLPCRTRPSKLMDVFQYIDRPLSRRYLCPE